MKLYRTEGLDDYENRFVSDQWLADVGHEQLVKKMREYSTHLNATQIAEKALAIRLRYAELDAMLISKQLCAEFGLDEEED